MSNEQDFQMLVKNAQRMLESMMIHFMEQAQKLQDPESQFQDLHQYQQFVELWRAVRIRAQETEDMWQANLDKRVALYSELMQKAMSKTFDSMDNP